jgi:hypothetical protein
VTAQRLAHYPPMDALLSAVRDYLGVAMVSMPDGDKYQARIATHLLDICIRELGGADDRPNAHLAGLLGCERDEVTLSLRQYLAAPRSEHDDQALLSALIADSVAALELVRPDHLAPEHAPRP